MIKLASGNFVLANVEALVNPVNCVGVMGAGLALQFKNQFPENYRQYKHACDVNEVKPGKMFVTLELTSPMLPAYIINFPTKRHWREASRLEDIALGLRDLVRVIRKLNIRSVAIPPLGCGLGGLDWKVVRPLIEETFLELPHVRTLLYPPK